MTQPTPNGTFHHYLSAQEIEGSAFYLYAPLRTAPSDQAAQLFGPFVIVSFKGCNNTGCAAVASTQASPNHSLVFFNKRDDIVGWAIDRKDGSNISHDVAHAEAGSILEQIREDGLAGQLKLSTPMTGGSGSSSGE